jgi:hypothetical protein
MQGVKGMTDTDKTSEAGATPLREVPVLRTQGLLAEYTTGRAPSGEWFALGTVRSEIPLPSPPAWILVGTGRSAEDAVGGLLIELETEARRVFR